MRVAAKARGRKLGLAEAVALGVGMVVGAGVFSVTGVGAELAGRNLPEAFAAAAAVALGVVHSYSHLARRFVSDAGPVEYVARAFGDNFFTGWIAFIFWFIFVASVALFARTMAAYLLAAIGAATPQAEALTALVAVAAFTLLDLAGARAVGRAELVLTALKLGILLLFIAAGLVAVKPWRLSPDPARALGAAYAIGILLLTYSGFDVIATSSEEIEEPEKNVPRAMALTVIIAALIYVGVAVVVIGSLPLSEVVRARDYALAEAALPALGRLGFNLVALGATVATASAAIAAIYGGANVAYALAKKGELPEVFERRAWGGEPEGLYITSIAAAALASTLSLDGVAAVTSVAFLVLYAAVVASHIKLRRIVGGSTVVAYATLAALVASIAAVLHFMATSRPASLLAVAVGFTCFAVAEAALRLARGRRIKVHLRAKSLS